MTKGVKQPFFTFHACHSFSAFILCSWHLNIFFATILELNGACLWRNTKDKSERTGSRTISLQPATTRRSLITRQNELYLGMENPRFKTIHFAHRLESDLRGCNHNVVATQRTANNSTLNLVLMQYRLRIHITLVCVQINLLWCSFTLEITLGSRWQFSSSFKLNSFQ